MKKTINKKSINHVAKPMLEKQAKLVERFQNEYVVGKRRKNKFLFSNRDDELTYPIFFGYDLSYEDRYNLSERQAVEELFQIYGRQWMKNNEFIELH